MVVKMANIPLMTVEELHSKMNSGEELMILDVRNETDYSDWRIEGKKVRSINIPYFNFLDDDDKMYEDLPKGVEMVVVCAKGGSSEFIVENLMERGFKTYSLEGGMLDWSQFYHPTTVYKDEKIELIQINRFSKGCLSYAVVSEGKAMIVDPNQKTEVYVELAKQRDFKIEHIVDSHLHADHISGGIQLAKETGAAYYISAGEAQGTELKFEPLDKHGKIRVGEVDVEVLAVPTPGHTPGSTSFLINNQFMMSGDTIFVGGLGRPDLGGKAQEWAADLYDTVFNKLKDLPGDCMILPSHYADIQEINDNGIVGATFREIRNNNEIMRNANKEDFTQQVAGAVSTEKPPNFEEIISINRGELNVSLEKAIELEIGPNRCAVHHHG